MFRIWQALRNSHLPITNKALIIKAVFRFAFCFEKMNPLSRIHFQFGSRVYFLLRAFLAVLVKLREEDGGKDNRETATTDIRPIIID